MEDLEANGLMQEIEDYILTIPRGDRSGAILEPLITNQWFLKMEPLAEPAITVVKNGELKFVPENCLKPIRVVRKYSGLVYLKATLVGSQNSSLV